MHPRRLLLILATAGLAVSMSAGIASANHFSTLATSLSGAEEAPGPGDSNGKGSVTLEVYDYGLVCYTLKVQGIATPTGAHIHEATAGSPGPVVVDFRLDLATRRGNTFSYCVNAGPTAADAEARAADIQATPTAYYVNVHNAEFPGGAVRGQLGD